MTPRVSLAWGLRRCTLWGNARIPQNTIMDNPYALREVRVQLGALAPKPETLNPKPQ